MLIFQSVKTFIYNSLYLDLIENILLWREKRLEKTNWSYSPLKFNQLVYTSIHVHLYYSLNIRYESGSDKSEREDVPSRPKQATKSASKPPPQAISLQIPTTPVPNHQSASINSSKLLITFTSYRWPCKCNSINI